MDDDYISVPRNTIERTLIALKWWMPDQGTEQKTPIVGELESYLNNAQSTNRRAIEE